MPLWWNADTRNMYSGAPLGHPLVHRVFHRWHATRLRAPTLSSSSWGLDPGGEQFGVPIWTPSEVFRAGRFPTCTPSPPPDPVYGNRPFGPLLGLRPALSMLHQHSRSRGPRPLMPHWHSPDPQICPYRSPGMRPYLCLRTSMDRQCSVIL